MRSFDRRLRRLEQQAPETAWLYGEGLAALLAAAQQSPRHPWDDDLDDEAPCSGMAVLLQEARAWMAEQEDR
jgi:hypothetical protein